MKITSIQINSVYLPLKVPFVVSYDSYLNVPSVIVKIETDEGITGYGEGVADEHVTGESIESVYHIIKSTLAPKLLGLNPMNIEKIHDEMNKAIYGVPAAKAAIDIACFDILGKKLQQPVYQLIGGRYHEKFPITHVLSIDTPNQMADEAAWMVEMGYRSLKLKVGRNDHLDVKRIHAVRKRVGEEIAIRVDVNQGWKNSADTLVALSQLQDCRIDWLEQPVIADDIDGMVEIKSKSTVPLMIDEGLRNHRDMLEIIQKRAAHKVNIKLMKCGGIYPAVKLAHQAELAGMECQIGSMVESSVGSAAGFHVAFSKKIITSVELTGPLKFSEDIGDLHYEIPFIKLTEKPGLGIEVNDHILEKLTKYTDIIK